MECGEYELLRRAENHGGGAPVEPWAALDLTLVRPPPVYTSHIRGPCECVCF